MIQFRVFSLLVKQIQKIHTISNLYFLKFHAFCCCILSTDKQKGGGVGFQNSQNFQWKKKTHALAMFPT